MKSRLDKLQEKTDECTALSLDARESGLVFKPDAKEASFQTGII